jgi:hypothetical protein
LNSLCSVENVVLHVTETSECSYYINLGGTAGNPLVPLLG